MRFCPLYRDAEGTRKNGVWNKNCCSSYPEGSCSFSCLWRSPAASDSVNACWFLKHREIGKVIIARIKFWVKSSWWSAVVCQVSCQSCQDQNPIFLYLQQAPWQLSPPVHWYCRISLYISYVWQRSHSSGIFCQATWSTCRWPVTLSPSQPRHPLSGRVVVWDDTVQPKVGFEKDHSLETYQPLHQSCAIYL